MGCAQTAAAMGNCARAASQKQPGKSNARDTIMTLKALKSVLKAGFGEQLHLQKQPHKSNAQDMIVTLRAMKQRSESKG